MCVNPPPALLRLALSTRELTPASVRQQPVRGGLHPCAAWGNAALRALLGAQGGKTLTGSCHRAYSPWISSWG